MSAKNTIDKMIKGFLKIFSGSSVKKAKFWKYVYNIALHELNIGTGSGVEKSGENNLLKEIQKESPQGDGLIIFDVGGNKGQYTSNLLKFFPKAEIHTFEPSVETFSELCKNVTASNVKLNNFGMSDQQSSMELYFDKEGSGLASVYNRQLDYYAIDFSKHETCRFDTLDNYCSSNNIKHIDLLKLDIEGHEFNALNGGKEMLLTKAIKYIQIEFGGCNIDSRTYFRDFWNLLHTNYSVYRIMRDGLYEIKKYDESLEIFLCTNYAFVLKE